MSGISLRVSRHLLSQKELGHLVGLSRQTVNRVLREMERLQLVSLAFGRVDILDEPGLLKVAAAD